MKEYITFKGVTFMNNFLLYIVPAYLVSYFLFGFIFRIIDLPKLLKDESKNCIIVILLGFIIFIAGVTITDLFVSVQAIHDILTGICFGELLAALRVSKIHQYQKKK